MVIEGLVGAILATQGNKAIDAAGSSIFDGNDKWNAAKQVKRGLVNIMANGHGNIVQLVSDYAIEPIIIVTENAFNLPEEIINNATNALRDIFASYYIRAFNIIVTNMGLSSVDAIKILSSNNRRASGLNTLLTIMESAEDTLNVNNKLVFTKDLSEIDKYDMRWIEGKKYLFSMEADILDVKAALYDDAKSYKGLSAARTLRRNENLDNKISLSADRHDNRHELAGDGKVHDFKGLNSGIIYKIGSRWIEFSVNGLNRVESKNTVKGKNSNSPVQDDDDDKNNTNYNIRIEISGKVIRVNTNHLKAYITPKLDDNSFGERFKKWRAGVISFKEFLFATDLVKDYKRIKAKQPTPINRINEMRQISSVKSQMDYGVRGTQANYNMVITTSGELKELCRFANKVITRYDDKDELLNKLNAIIILELDTANELAILHISGHYAPVTLSFKDLKKKGGEGKVEDTLLTFLETLGKNSSRGGMF